MSTSDQLQQAFQLIKNGNKSQATAILVPIVRAEPNNADAWWLMANAVSNADQQRRALEQVLRLRPNDEKARRMLDRIGGGYSAPPPPAYPQQQDPFAGSAYPPQQTYDPFAGSAPQADPFATNDPFAHVGGGQQTTWGAAPVHTAPPVIIRERRGTNPLVVFLAIIGILAVVSCGICFVATGGALGTIGTMVNQALGTLTADPDFGTAMQELGNIGLTLTADPNFSNLSGTLSSSMSAANLGSQLSGDYNERGAIEQGQTVTGTVDTFEDDGWTLNGSSGKELTIDLEATDDDLDPQLYVYDPEGALIAENDDVDFAGGNRNSQVVVTLPASGEYTIIVSAFGNGGDYELSVR